MKAVRCIEHTGKAKHITGFFGSSLKAVKPLVLQLYRDMNPAVQSEKLSRRRNAVVLKNRRSRSNSTKLAKLMVLDVAFPLLLFAVVTLEN